MMESRLLQISDLFRTGDRLTVRSLAHHFEVSERTIKRDIEVLRDQNQMDIQYDRKRMTYHLVNRSSAKSPLTATEFGALSLAAEMLERLAGTRFEQPLEQALKKVSGAMPPAVSWETGSRLADHSVATNPLRGEMDEVAHLLAELHQAIVSHHTVRVSYFTASRREHRERGIEPYHLHFRGDAWYCIGFCQLRRDVRTFAVQRMSHLRVTPQVFTPKPNFDLGKYFSSAWNVETGPAEQLVVRFAPSTAIYIRERVWHHTQTLEDQPDGSLVLRADVNCGGEVRRWLLQFGADAEVLSPDHLREDMAIAAQRMTGVYAEAT